MADQGQRIVGPDHLVAGRHRLRSKLGGGGMGSVWLATDTLLDREIALKQISFPDDLTPEGAAEVRARAMREGRLAARLSHPHAIAMYDVTLEGDDPWLVMEYMPSRSLAQALGVTETLPPPQVAQIGAQVAAALAEAHAAGIIHRDVKPGNILIADRGPDAGTVKISDFGISRARGEDQTARSSVIAGTPAFFAPEVARGADPTEASDVFSLGATLFTATEGQPPFGIDEDTRALLHRVAKAEIMRPVRSGALTDVLLRMLEPDPARRPTMIEARDLLARSAAGTDNGIAYVLDAPLREPDGTVPFWARRGASGGSPRPGRRLPSSTSGGLTAVPQPVPLQSVHRPSQQRPQPPAFEPKRPGPGIPVPLIAALVVAALLIVILVVALVA
ncbi:serine/threonine-protein kinase [Rhodococcus sp. NPDC058532]|uniref:serine/threonine-protein kinase n=1 Tax=Rhodococcus sp. NPDC058532 TaxID=3346540 RepID=UPI00366A15B2